MGDEYRADPVALAGLAKQTLAASTALGDALSGVLGSLEIPLQAFGNLSAAPAVHAGQQTAAATAGTTVGRLVAVYEDDVDKLYRTSSTYAAADQAAAEQAERVRGRIGGPI